MVAILHEVVIKFTPVHLAAKNVFHHLQFRVIHRARIDALVVKPLQMPFHLWLVRVSRQQHQPHLAQNNDGSGQRKNASDLLIPNHGVTDPGKITLNISHAINSVRIKFRV